MTEQEYYAQSWRLRDKRRLALLFFIFLANAAVGLFASNTFVAHLAQAVALAAVVLIIELIQARQLFARRPFLRLSNDGFRYIAFNIKWEVIREATVTEASQQAVVQTFNDQRIVQIAPPKLAKLLRVNMRSTGYAIVIPELKGIEPKQLVMEISKYLDRSRAQVAPPERSD